jgi:hypothetical protein
MFFSQGLTSCGRIFFQQQNFHLFIKVGRKFLERAGNTVQQFTVLPTGRLLGHITQQGPNKRGAARQICGRIFADFEQKEPKKGVFQKSLFFLLLFSMVPGKSRKIYTFPHSHIQRIVFSKQGLQKVKITGGRIFSSAAVFFCWTGRKVLPRVANTDKFPNRIH